MYRRRTGTNLTDLTCSGANQLLVGANPWRVRIEIGFDAGSGIIAFSSDDINTLKRLSIAVTSPYLIYDEVTHGNLPQRAIYVKAAVNSTISVLEVFTDEVPPEERQ